MKAAFITRLGPPDVIQFGELPDPTPGPSQCLIRVEAASVNPIDTYIRSGLVSMPISFPFVPGCDFAGNIVRTGAGVEQFRPGDRVWGSNQGLLGRQGVTSELAAVDAAWIYPAPPGVGTCALAANALVSITAGLGLVRHAKLERGETLLVHGAGGAVGSSAIQVAKALGARVFATTRNVERAKYCLELGADAVATYDDPNLPNAVREFAPQGVNVWWQTGRNPDFDLALACLAERGRMILMAGRDARPPFPVGAFYVKGCSLHGFAMFKATAEEQRSVASRINEWLSRGELKPAIDRVLPISRTAEAHRIQEDNTLHQIGSLRGKIVLEV